MKQNRRDAKPQKLNKLAHLYEMISAMILISTVLSDGQESNPEPVYRILRSTRRNRLDPHCYYWYVEFDVAVRLKVPLIR
jgi:hypothetical protein